MEQKSLSSKNISDQTKSNNALVQNNATYDDQKVEPVLPDMGLAIAYDKAHFQLCKPKLMPLKTFSFVKMAQARNKANNVATTKSGSN